MVASPSNPYNIFAPQSHRNHELYDQLRDEDPVHSAINPETGRVTWFLTRYDDCLSFLKDKRFGRDIRRLPPHLSSQWTAGYSNDIINQHMLNLDDPDHARLKSIVQLAFTPIRIQALRLKIQIIADSLFDHIDSTIADSDELDLTHLYISQLPLRILSDMLGIPDADYPRLFVWVNHMLLDDVDIVRAAILDFSIYLNKRIDDRQHQPMMIGDLLSELPFVELDGDRLNREELLAMVYLLITAGYETMVNFISNSIFTLLEYPDVIRELQENAYDGDLVQSAIEELLRYSGPAHMTIESWAFEDVTVRGKVIHQGDVVHAVLLAANRDPLIFVNPHDFDIHRHPNRHIAFSHGIHHCLGAALARLQSDIAIMTLLRRMPNL